MKSKGRVAMLMSGGVDSSVSAALLKEQGYEVIGFYILGWLGTPDFPCPWQKEEADARAVADQLGIPFHTINLSKVYEKEVIDRFFAGYQAGVTPNPDILCNREIKFKALWQAIRQFECDKIATGHYARLEREFQISNSKFLMNDSMNQFPKIENSGIENSLKIENLKLKINSHPAIFKARDEKKDQSYFLWGIEPAMLSKIIFPLGEITKPEVRRLAKKYKLPTATKKDSQGICFVGPLKVRQFLASKVKTKSGDVYLVDSPSTRLGVNRKVATHQGVELYTIGQRLAAGSVDWTGDVPPLFVIAKDISNNRLIVGSDSQTFGHRLVAGSLNWLASFTPSPVEGSPVEGLTESPDSANYEKLARLPLRGTSGQETANWPACHCEARADRKLTSSIWREASASDKTKFEALAKIRYRQEDEVVHIHQVDAKLFVEFVRPVRALTAGQSIVFYTTDGQLLGGGIIELVPEQDETIQRLAKALGQTKV